MVAQGLVCRDEGFDAVNLTETRTELGLQSASPLKHLAMVGRVKALKSGNAWLLDKLDLAFVR